MWTQWALLFEEVPVTRPVQRRYHAIAPLLAGQSSIVERAQAFSAGYSTVSRRFREFRERGWTEFYQVRELARRS